MKPYDDGYQANLDGELRDESKCEDWLRGFDAAQVVRDEWEADNHERALAFGD